MGFEGGQVGRGPPPGVPLPVVSFLSTAAHEGRRQKAARMQDAGCRSPACFGGRAKGKWDHRLIVGGLRTQEDDGHGFAAKGAMSHMLKSRNGKDAAGRYDLPFRPYIIYAAMTWT